MTVEYSQKIQVVHRTMKLGIEQPHYNGFPADHSNYITTDLQVPQLTASQLPCNINSWAESPDRSETVGQTSSQKPRKGIRNKAIERGVGVIDTKQVLPDSTSECAMERNQQIQQDTEVSAMEKADEDFATSERMPADVSSPCTTGPPGLGHRRAYRSPAKLNRDSARLNRRAVHQEQTHQSEEEADQDLGLSDTNRTTEQRATSDLTEGTDLVSTLTRSDMLKWRSFVLSEQLSEHTKVWGVLRVEANIVAPQNWREEAVFTQQKKGKGKGKGDLYQKNREPGQPVLKPSENSWSAQQKQMTKKCNNPEKSDEEIVRTMKAILNKLTMKKYDTLYQQILDCGMWTVEHVAILIDEVLEKAETQHHFIQMYCQLCVDLHKWFDERSSSSSVDPQEHSFKRILLNRCQNKFEDNLSLRNHPDLSSVREDEAQEAMSKHKLAMLGNIKFIGALLEKGMLGDRCLGHVAQELCEANAPHALESLAVFLTAVGPKFDHRNFTHYAQLCAIFLQVEEKSKDKSIETRIRYKLQDVLDLRAVHWRSAS
eukprot:gnl/MRDRNA2_/MRDRNA2_73265_c0_seq2.p1 gnl/MRDRNA2_/MRDRNA2_73265_c0~~gnl/MRDRNA2_/MRDRNA2_73265_c0_seq2.p1  ORF type:complete len:618 (+),score=97.24 gnl/MRDRNA2_/MRDRNA2_73265_c0_seq2:230-1855(+)